MSRLRLAFLLLLPVLAGPCIPLKGAAAERPNVVVILTDDQGWGDLSASGNRNLQTPHIDSLKRDGVSLERFYVCPVCSPTRAEFLTGRYHPRTGVRGVSTGQERLNLDETTVADTLKAAGYATGAFGKWHNGSQWPYHPNARGFEEYYGFTSGHWGEYFDPPLDHNGQPVRGRGYMADDLTDKAMEFIRKNREKPFFCYLPYNTPHTPWAVPASWWDRHRDREPQLKATEKDKEKTEETRCALAMMENLDWNVGRVLDQLKELDLTRRTIVIFFSDNGPNTHRWNGGMKGKKGGTDEGSVRSVCYLRWPGSLPEGRVVEEITAAIDLAPTLAALTGTRQEAGKPLDGRDLSPLLKGPVPDWPERLIFSTFNGAVSVRSQQYRLDAKGALFDMKADPAQTHDTAARNSAEHARLTSAVAAWRKEMLGPSDAPTPRKAQARVRAMDSRPCPVGYPEFPRTPLPARDGWPERGVKRSASAPNCSYFVGWTSKDDAMVWDVDVHTTGTYRVEILYTCPEADAGSLVELSHGEHRLTGRVQPAWDPPLYENQDTLPRPPAESRMKEFRTLDLGQMSLTKGRGPLRLRALEIPGRSVMDVRQVNLILLPNP